MGLSRPLWNPNQQHVGLHHAFWWQQQEVTRPKERLKPTSPEKSGRKSGNLFFGPFKAWTKFYNKQMWYIYPSSIWCWDSNSRPLGHEFLPGQSHNFTNDHICRTDFWQNTFVSLDLGWSRNTRLCQQNYYTITGLTVEHYSGRC